MEKVVKFLQELNACKEAINFVNTQKDWESVIKNCERADWLLWLASRMIDEEGWPTRKQVVWAICQCARLALPYVDKGELRPLQAIETTEAWTRGEATEGQVSAASAAASVAASVVVSAVSAVYAAAVVSAAASAAASAAVSAVYAAAVASVVASVASATSEAAKLKTHKKMCDIIRENLKFPEVKF